MKTTWPLLASAALVALLALACDGGTPAPRPVTPAPAAPRDVIAFGAREASGYGLYLIDRDGANMRRVSEEAGAVSVPAWSPDGARIAYMASPAGGGPAILRIYDFATASATTASEQAFVGQLGARAAWSPDGKRLAFVEASGGAGRLRVYDFASAAMLDTADVPASAVAWSPTSSQVTVVRPGDTAQSSDIATVKVDGSDLGVILSGALEGDPRWSPDGKLLATWIAPSAQLTARRLQVVKAKGLELRGLGPGLDPAWSPDGKLLAYSRPAAATAGAGIDIYTVAATGGAPELISQSATRARWPSWSPAGDALVFLAQADQNTAFLCVVTLATKKSTCLQTEGLVPAQPAWAPF